MNFHAGAAAGRSRSRRRGPKAPLSLPTAAAGAQRVAGSRGKKRAGVRSWHELDCTLSAAGSECGGGAAHVAQLARICSGARFARLNFAQTQLQHPGDCQALSTGQSWTWQGPAQLSRHPAAAAPVRAQPLQALRETPSKSNHNLHIAARLAERGAKPVIGCFSCMIRRASPGCQCAPQAGAPALANAGLPATTVNALAVRSPPGDACRRPARSQTGRASNVMSDPDCLRRPSQLADPSSPPTSVRGSPAAAADPQTTAQC